MFFEGQRWKFLVIGTAVVLGILVSMPQWLHKIDDRYRGVSVHLNSDEFSYLPRLQQALIGRLDELGTAVTGGEEYLPILQPGLIEGVYGVFFAPFTTRASKVFDWMDMFIPFVLFLTLVGFLRVCGMSRKYAYITAVLFCLLQLYGLGRPIHQRTSFLLSLLSIWGLISGLEKRKLWGFLGGALMGLLVGVYFWSWTFVWTYLGVLILIMLWDLRRKRIADIGERLAKIWKLFLFGGVGVLVATPFFWRTYLLSQHPLFEEVFFRSGMGKSHMPESIPWSVLFLFMAVGVSMLWGKGGGGRQKDMYLVGFIVTAFAVLNQHVVHGVRFLFASHYLMFLVFAGVCALVYTWSVWSSSHEKSRAVALLSVVTMGASLLFLSGIAYDNRHLIDQWRVDDADFNQQDLASMVPVLNQLERTVIMADPLTSAFIASHTHHDVLYTYYIQHEMRSHEELAERYCLTQVPLPLDKRRPADEPVLIYGAAYDAIDDPVMKEDVRREELKLVERTCSDVNWNFEKYLQKYNVSHVLWRLNELNLPIQRIGGNPNWGLWRL
jgi:hypothetical protein